MRWETRQSYTTPIGPAVTVVHYSPDRGVEVKLDLRGLGVYLTRGEAQQLADDLAHAVGSRRDELAEFAQSTPYTASQIADRLYPFIRSGILASALLDVVDENKIADDLRARGWSVERLDVLRGARRPRGRGLS